MSRQRLIHLSDMHIGRGRKESKLTELVIRRVAELYPGIPVIITGDLTDSGRPKQFAAARAILDSLARTNPILAVPGNHDYAWKGNVVLDRKAWGHWVATFGSPLGWNRQCPSYWTGPGQTQGGVEGLGVWEDGDIVYFGIDSGDPRDQQICARGLISRALAIDLDKALQAHQNKTRVAFLHHHPFSGGLGHIFTALHGSKRLMKVIRNQCELFLFGHKHEYGIWHHYSGVPLIVSSHKTSEVVSGECCAFTVIEIKDAGSDAVSFSHRLEMVQNP